MKKPDGIRLATVRVDSRKISYWEVGEEVYRLNEYEPVQFDIYGVPLGARWETNRFNWDHFKAVIIGSDNLVPDAQQVRLSELHDGARLV